MLRNMSISIRLRSAKKILLKRTVKKYTTDERTLLRETEEHIQATLITLQRSNTTVS
jgi:hypothetical protein